MILRKYSNKTLFDRPHWPAFRGELSGGGFGKLETIEGRDSVSVWALRELSGERALLVERLGRRTRRRAVELGGISG